MVTMKGWAIWPKFIINIFLIVYLNINIVKILLAYLEIITSGVDVMIKLVTTKNSPVSSETYIIYCKNSL